MTEVTGRVHSELCLRPSNIWTIPAFSVDALAIFERRVQTRLRCTHQIYGHVPGGELMCNRYCTLFAAA